MGAGNISVGSKSPRHIADRLWMASSYVE